MEKKNRFAGLDGLRAIAVLAVLLFHSDLAWARGGFLGVDLFFLISGFLITSLLVQEFQKTGQISLKDFFLRRARRLLPAVWLMIPAIVVAAAFLAQDALPRLRQEVLAALFYLNNWQLIFSEQSYFESIGRSPLLMHLWSLAIEEQFYLFWAPLLFLLLPKLKQRTLAFVALLLAAAGIVWMASYAGETSRLYFGTDTHSFGLFLGAALALIWHPDRYQNANLFRTYGVATLGVSSLTCLVFLFAFLGEDTEWLYPWGFLITYVFSIALLISVTLLKKSFGAFMDNRFLRWVGERSYGIYLWHWPIFMLTRPGVDLQTSETETLLLRFGFTLGAAALSYHFVEQPIRSGSYRGLRSSIKAWLSLPAIAVISIMIGFLSMSPNNAALPKDVYEAIYGDSSTIKQPTKEETQLGVTSPPAPAHANADQNTVPVTSQDLTAIGDSVLLGAERRLKKEIPDAKVYAKVSKQAAQVLKDVRALNSQRELSRNVLVHLGTNGYVTEKQLRSILEEVVEQHLVILVNARVPKQWMGPNNQLLARVASEYQNVTLMDWARISEDHREYFVSDGVHLTAKGQDAFVNGIEKILVTKTSPLAQTNSDNAATSKR